MKLSALLLLGPGLLAASSAGAQEVVTATPEPEPEALLELLETANTTIIEQLAETEAKVRKRGGTPGCTLSKLGLRRE